VAFDQNPTVAAVYPMMGNPDGAFARRVVPVAAIPDVVMAIPAVIAVDPHISGMRCMLVMFMERWGRRNADNDLCYCRRRSET
jgi:hypothetical protein